MIRIRKSRERGHFNHGWLDTFHTFSFGDYYDSRFNQFRSLRVINEDRVDPGQGFGMHGHRDMEIVTLVLEGELEHQDSLGNGSVLRAGELQRMTAGTGIRHSEFNPSKSEAVHLYQIWLLPEKAGLTPGWEQKAFPEQVGTNFRVVASPDARDGSLKIHQNALLLRATLKPGEETSYEVAEGRHLWLQILRGNVTLADGSALSAGDGAAFSEESSLRLKGVDAAEVLLFDLA